MVKIKKKQKKTASGAAPELESAIHSHADFFDQLVQLIPPRFYLQNEDADSKPWYGGLSNIAKNSLKNQSKINRKHSRRQRFDPEHEVAKSPEENLTGNSVEEPAKDGDKEKEKSVTYEELRQKLRRKIEMLRGNRGEGRVEGKKRRRSDENDDEESGEEVDEAEEEEEEEIEYGKVKVGDDEVDEKKKRRKLSKGHELERAKRLQEVKKEKPTVAEKESWKAAASRAMGVKVHDNPRLIKESMRRDKKKKEKNAEKWKDRVETQAKMKGDRQKKRTENIVGRINDKKQRKIAKREKKLMRPGFEGRKAGFITPS